jgi:hypothetical protein
LSLIKDTNNEDLSKETRIILNEGQELVAIISKIISNTRK